MIVRQNKYTNFSPYNKGFCSVNQNKSLLFTPPLRIEQGRHETGETSQPLPPALSASLLPRIKDSMGCKNKVQADEDCLSGSMTERKCNPEVRCGWHAGNNDTRRAEHATDEKSADHGCSIQDTGDRLIVCRIVPITNSNRDSGHRSDGTDRLLLHEI